MAAELDSSGGSSPEQDVVHDLPPSPKSLKRSSTLSNPYRHQHRHSKRLSLNFPILVPPATGITKPVHDSGSPGMTPSTVFSPEQSSPHAKRSSTATSQISPSTTESNKKVGTAEAPDFLTLLASQERKVLELKEELQKAERELTILKSQWAVHEANKKRGELKHKTLKLGPVSPESSRFTQEDDNERERRREARERRLKGLGIVDGENSSGSSSPRKTGQRIFEGRHTRTLSLLQNGTFQAGSPQLALDGTHSSEESIVPGIERRATESAAPNTEPIGALSPLASTPTLSRQSSVLSGSGTAAELTFGKTYKDLANGRRSMPPGADVFVKQGKQMYEGVSQGFWNFVEDIRQATIGEEAINGTPLPGDREPRRTKSRLKNDGALCERHGKRGPRRALDTLENNTTGKKDADSHKREKDKFWKEFGLETPQTHRQDQESVHVHPVTINLSKETIGGKEHESKSSTDSKSPPGLLSDLIDGHDDDWDNWTGESPMTLKRQSVGPMFRERGSVDGQSDDATEFLDTSQGGKSSSHIPNSSISWAELTR